MPCSLRDAADRRSIMPSGETQPQPALVRDRESANRYAFVLCAG